MFRRIQHRAPHQSLAPTAARARLVNGLYILCAIWLIIAPFVLHYLRYRAYANDILLGIIIGAIALAWATGIYWVRRLLWLSALAGIWLIIAPFVLHYTTTRASANDIGMGAIVLLLAVSGATAVRSYRKRTSRI
jgi:hypothetical protein